MRHAVIVRMIYNDEEFRKRLALFAETAYRSLCKQTDKNFDVLIKCNPSHFAWVKSIGLKPFCQTVPPERDEKGRFKDFVGWDKIRELSPGDYDLYSSLDSDDFVHPEYIARVKQECDEENLHIHFQPRLYNIKTGEEKETKRKYGEKGSAFYSLYKSPYFIGCDSHLKMPQYANKSKLIDGYCWIGIHDDNDSSHMEI